MVIKDFEANNWQKFPVYAFAQWPKKVSVQWSGLCVFVFAPIKNSTIMQDHKNAPSLDFFGYFFIKKKSNE
ncbi:hypothetical protein EDM02_01730 [Candidatus Cardinium hertigii]|jgi:hypothetical protein|uniref:Uncharacterized protein n=1 Tax=Candidatus Cardinium hertigii TaxID=247481 RepID=A0A3N2QCL6_9BACT|nr:hypothetical protein EDM02_01915 [Candidatus Cardinium hertigii]ROT47546.1 hypothetical protein EDM02_01730 [Candidatus Cardinium hertigii]